MANTANIKPPKKIKTLADITGNRPKGKDPHGKWKRDSKSNKKQLTLNRSPPLLRSDGRGYGMTPPDDRKVKKWKV